MKKQFAVLAGLLMFAIVIGSHAQTAVLGSLNNDLMPVLPTQPDSYVQAAAESQGLAQVAPADLPIAGGTYWWVLPSGFAVPAPCPPQDVNAPIYQIVGNIFLVDETGGQVVFNPHQFGLPLRTQPTSSMMAAAVVAQTQAVSDLITQVQTRVANQQMRAMAQAMGMDIPTPGSGDSGDGSGGFGTGVTYTIQRMACGWKWSASPMAWLNVNLHGATNQVYEIFTKTDLLDAKLEH